MLDLFEYNTEQTFGQIRLFKSYFELHLVDGKTESDF
jgi:hypothetical protein